MTATKRHTAASAALILCLLAACGKKEDPKPAVLACADPAVAADIRTVLQQNIKEQARAFAANDTRGYVDPDKIIAAAADLAVALDNAQQDNSGTKPVCQAELSVTLPADALKTAQHNAPILYGDKALDKVIAERLKNSDITYAGGVFSRTVRYTPVKNSAGGFNITYADGGLSAAANALSGALLPYGVKSLLRIGDNAITIEEALKLAKSGGKIEIVEETASEPETASAPPAETRTEEAKPEETKPAEPGHGAEPAAPPVEEDIEDARSEHQNAEREINAVWRGLDPVIQQTLQEEQRDWISRKTAACRRAAAQAERPARAEYLRLQCDTRQTRERTEYLRGYSDSE